MAPALNSDPLAAALAFLPGIVIQRNLTDAIMTAVALNGGAILTQAQAVACLAAANALDRNTMAASGDETDDPTIMPLYPAAPPVPLGCPGGIFVGPDAAAPPVVLGGLPRFEDSNPAALDDWVQYGPEANGEDMGT
jgi:hypothetical protein